MSDLIPFQFENHPVRVHLDTHGNPWWEAQDVCDILGLKDVSQAVARLRLGEKRTSETRNALIINEKGLYRLIMRSNKPDAERFQDWVFGEVLPTIRKTGKYEVAPSILDRHPDMKAIAELATGIAEAREVAAEAQARAHAAELVAARAETKADIALAEAQRMTLEHFVMVNGLVHQFPPLEWSRLGKWLSQWCLDFNQEARTEPVVGKDWPTERAYPLCAFSAMLRHEKLRSRQLTMVARPQRERSTI